MGERQRGTKRRWQGDNRNGKGDQSGEVNVNTNTGGENGREDFFKVDCELPRRGTHTQGAYDAAHVMRLCEFPLMGYIRTK